MFDPQFVGEQFRALAKLHPGLRSVAVRLPVGDRLPDDFADELDPPLPGRSLDRLPLYASAAETTHGFRVLHWITPRHRGEHDWRVPIGQLRYLLSLIPRAPGHEQEGRFDAWLLALHSWPVAGATGHAVSVVEDIFEASAKLVIDFSEG